MVKYIGLTGRLGAGKNIVREMLASKLGMNRYGFGDLLREESKKRGIEINRKNLQDLGNQLRKEDGGDILAKRILEKVKNGGILDGINNPQEVKYFRDKLGKEFVLVAIDAPKEMRFRRLVKRGRSDDPKNWKEFEQMDQRENGVGEPEYGQHVADCIALADWVIVNDGSLTELERKVDKLAKWIKRS